MRATEYLARKKQEASYIRSKGRYVMGMLHSHRRPVEEDRIPQEAIPKDSPETRGITQGPND